MMEPTWMSEKQLAAYWNISRKTLQRWRAMGRGPTYVRVGKSIRYRQSDAAEFEINVAIKETQPDEHRRLRLSTTPDETVLSPVHKATLLLIRQFLKATIRL